MIIKKKQKKKKDVFLNKGRRTIHRALAAWLTKSYINEDHLDNDGKVDKKMAPWIKRLLTYKHNK